MGMTYIEAPNLYNADNKPAFSLFLAGGITNCPNWQQELVNLLEDELLSGMNLVIYNPRRENFPIGDPKAAYEQIEWEHTHLAKADIISFWFSRGSPNPIVFFEYGKWFNTGKPVFLGIDPEFNRKQDVLIQSELELGSEFEYSSSLKDLAKRITGFIDCYTIID